MKRAVLVAILYLASACDSRPTRPTVVAANTPTVPVPTPLSDIAGDWKGTVAYTYADDWCACCVPGREASASFTQNGSQVTGAMHTACFDEQVIGTLQSGKFVGKASVSTSTIQYEGAASAQATATGMRLVTEGLQGNGQAVSGYALTLTR